MASIRILVVEDEDNIAYVVESALRVNGFEVVRAKTGHAALAAVVAEQPHLIMLDVMLGDLDGFDVCRRLRRDGIDAPVLFLTARDSSEERLRGLTIGGDDYVTKPFSVEELVARVRNILRRVGAGAPEREILRCGPVEVDDEAHVVRRDGREVSVPPPSTSCCDSCCVTEDGSCRAGRFSIMCGTIPSTVSRPSWRRSCLRCVARSTQARID